MTAALVGAGIGVWIALTGAAALAALDGNRRRLAVRLAAAVALAAVLLVVAARGPL